MPYKAYEQFKPFHKRTQRWAVLVCHRRAGKTVACINDLIKRALQENKPDGRYALVAPFYNQVKDLGWQYLKLYAGPVLSEPPRESELSVLLANGARIRLYGGDNPDRLKGIYLDGVVVDEFADCDPRLWDETILPTLVDRSGWAVIIGTPKGKNAFWKVYSDAQKDTSWYHLMLKASTSGILSAAQIDALRKNMTQDKFEQEMECSFEAAIQGAFYATEMRTMLAEGRIGKVEVDKNVRVHTGWDLGVSDSTAIWFIQCVGRERRLVDYYESSGVGLNHYAELLHSKRMEHGWQYGEHYFPHDIEHRELTTGTTRLDALGALGIKATVVPRSNLLDGIEEVRKVLGRTWINEERCPRGLEALRQYRREYDDRLKDWKANPLHDWTCVTGDTLVLTRYGMRPIMSLPQTGKVLTPCGWKQYRAPRITRRNAPLVEVRFSDGLSVKCTAEHLFLTTSGWRFADDLQAGLQIQSSLTRLRSIGMAAYIACGRAKNIIRAAVSVCTSMFGNASLVPFPAVAISTTEMAIQLTTTLRIWNACQWQNTYRSLGVKEWSADASIHLIPRPGNEPPNGIGQKPGNYGISVTQNEPRDGLSGGAKIARAWSAVKSFLVLSAQMVINKSSAVRLAKPLTIESVRRLHYCQDVWCLTVDDGGVWSLANGAVTHNSHSTDALRTFVLGFEDSANFPPKRYRPRPDDGASPWSA